MVDMLHIALGLAFVGLFMVTMLMFWMLGSEGRFMLSRNISGGRGADLLQFNPLTGGLELNSINYDGKFWTRKRGNAKEGIWFGFESLLSPDDAEGKQFNEAMTSKSYWSGCRRPVLLNSLDMDFIFTPQLSALFTQASKVEGLKKDEVTKLADTLNEAVDVGLKAKIEGLSDERLRSALTRLRGFYRAGCQSVKIVERIEPSTIKGFVDGNSSLHNVEVQDSGEVTGMLRMTRPKRPGQGGFPWKIVVIFIIGIALVGLVVFLVQSGMLQGIVGGAFN